MHIVYYYSFCFGWQGSRWKNKRTLGGRHVCRNVNGILKLMSCAHFLQFLYLVVGVICNLICLDLPLSICYRANRLMLTHVQKQLGQNVELYCGIASHHILILIFVLQCNNNIHRIMHRYLVMYIQQQVLLQMKM